MIILKYKRNFKIKKFINIKNEFLGLCQFGFYGIKALNSALITPNQIEESRRIAIRISKRVGKIYLRIVFNHVLTSKSHGSRMGKGVGKIKNWIAYIKKGSIFIEMLGISKKLAIKSFKAIKYILPIKLSLIFRDLLIV